MNQQHIVALFLASPERTSELSQFLASGGSTPLGAGNTDELHRALNGQRIDLLILEQKLSGFLSGLEILGRLHQDLVRPATLLVGTLSTEEREKAKSLGVVAMLPATTPLAEVAAAASKSLQQPESAPVAPIPLEARRLVQGCDSIQPLPQVLIKISGHLDQDRASIPELAKDISLDARLTAMLLRLVNSTAFALRTKLTKVQDAVNYLGMRRTISLVISAYLIRAQSGLAKNLPDSLRLWHQRRSVLIASAASAFARRADGLSQETAYVMGLLQDFGILLMAQSLGIQYIQLVERVKEIAQLRLDVLEQKSFGVTHADVSAALLQKWELPASLIPCVLYHHAKGEEQPMSTAEKRFTHVMQIGEALANTLDNCTPHRNHILNRLLAGGEFGSMDDVKTCLGEAVAKTAESSQLFSVPTPEPAELRALLEKIARDFTDLKTFVEEDDFSKDVESAAPPPVKIPEGTRSAVIMEENAVQSEAISRYLTSAAVWPVVCNTPAEARERARGAWAVLCNLTLGSTEGVDLVRQLRIDGFRGIIIAISQDRSRATVGAAIQAGISAFLPKPFTKTMLLEKLGLSDNQAADSGDDAPAPVTAPLQSSATP